MKILALEIEKPEATAAQFQELSQAEAHRIWELYQQGVVRELYYRQDRSEAVLMLECENEADAKAILQTLPLVEADAITFELIPLVAYPGFSRLFTSSQS